MEVRPGQRESCRREVMSSLLKIRLGCHSTVRGLIKSREPISGLERPVRARAAIWVSWAVSWYLFSGMRLRAVSPVAISSRSRRGGRRRGRRWW